MITTLTSTWQRFPSRFWVLVGSNFIDRLGSTMVWPFFSLYLTQKFEVGMTQVGVMLGLFSLSGFIGGMIGGALSDRFGRRGVIIFGTLASALSSIAFGVANQFWIFYVLAVVVGLPSRMAGPAYMAMIADVLPEEQRSEGFGIQRVVINMAWIIGPLIGAFLISYSYLLIFLVDAFASIIVAVIFIRVMKETKPEGTVREETEPLSNAFLGYFKVAKDWLFLAFTIAMIFSLLPYQQIYSRWQFSCAMCMVFQSRGSAI
jgi:MFS family permease